ncbi:type IX secretion system membrane protein PorP/SprF [bacterium]|nr:type IX secretion system membrane protein PorP/SprF [bacterium]
MSFFSPMYSEQEYLLSYGKRLTKPRSIQEEMDRAGLFGGLNMEILNRRYREDNFQLGEPDPLFEEYGYSKWGFGFGLGACYNFRNSYYGIYCRNLNQPNMALEKGEKDAIPFEIGLEAEYGITPDFNVKTNFVYINEDKDFNKNINGILNLDYWLLPNRFNINTELNFNTASLGFNYRFHPKNGFEIGYNFFYPYSNLPTTHHFYFNFRFKPPPPLYPDLTITKGAFIKKGHPIIGDSIKASCTLENTGRRPAKGFWVGVEKNGKKLTEVKVDRVEKGGFKEVEFDWIPEISGKHEFVIKIDEKNDVLEADEENNEEKSKIEIVEKPQTSFTAKRQILKLKQITSIVEDEPIIPIIFFDVNSSTVDSRFNRFLDLIGQRLLDNPGVNLFLEGYWNPASEGRKSKQAGKDLALKRAQAIKDKLTESFPVLQERIEIRDTGYDFSVPRAVKEQFGGTTKGPELIAEENRRVEISAITTSENVFIFDIQKITTDDSEALNKFSEISQFCKNNKDIYLMVSIEGEPRNSRHNLLSTADTIRNILINNYKELKKERVFIHSREIDDMEPRVKIILSPAAIIFKPNRKKQVFDDYVLDPVYNSVIISPEAQTDAGIKDYSCKIFNSDNDAVKKLYHSNTVPSEIKWDWKNNEGELVNIDDYYRIKVELEDTMGQKALYTSESLTVELTNVEQISERLILVQFVFAGRESEAGYADARLEYIAQKIIDRIKSQEGLDVIVGGHTDIVGTKSGNIRLSKERADAQLQNLKNYMMVLLGFTSMDELNDWLDDNSIRLKPEGYGSSRPYTITREEGELKQRIVIGNNNTPEGRIINRRVEVNFIGK